MRRQVATQCLRKAIWVGEHDADILANSTGMPAHVSSQAEKVQNILLNQFQPLIQQIVSRDTLADRLQNEHKEKEEAVAKGRSVNA